MRRMGKVKVLGVGEEEWRCEYRLSASLYKPFATSFVTVMSLFMEGYSTIFGHLMLCHFQLYSPNLVCVALVFVVFTK